MVTDAQYADLVLSAAHAGLLPRHWLSASHQAKAQLGQRLVAQCPFHGRWAEFLRHSPHYRTWFNGQAGEFPRRKRVRVGAIRNLLYHVCPLKANEVWRDNVRELRQRWHVFNGRKAVAVVYGDGIHDLREVRREFGCGGIEWLHLPNDPVLREVATFLPLLIVASQCPKESVTFYAHTKGNSTAENARGAELWRNIMYRTLLDQCETVRAQLQTHAAIGTTRMIWPANAVPPYPTRLNHGNWMFAGTFWWFRNDMVFARNWRSVPADRYGAEAWLSGMFRADECLSLYQPWDENSYPTPSPYDIATHNVVTCKN